MGRVLKESGIKKIMTTFKEEETISNRAFQNLYYLILTYLVEIYII